MRGERRRPHGRDPGQEQGGQRPGRGDLGPGDVADHAPRMLGCAEGGGRGQSVPQRLGEQHPPDGDGQAGRAHQRGQQDVAPLERRGQGHGDGGHQRQPERSPRALEHPAEGRRRVDGDRDQG